MAAASGPLIVHRFRDHEIVEKTGDGAKHQVISDPKQFEHAMAHTFSHEWSLSSVGPEFWRDNTIGAPCAYDHHSFSGPVFSYPISYHNHQWVVRKVFCSPHCMKKYATIRRDIPPRVFTLISLMMRMVYQWGGDVVPASDVEIIMNPLDPEWFGQIDKWRALPKEHVQMRLVLPMVIPFRMEKQNVASHVMRTHPAYTDLRSWNTTRAEPGPLPEEVVELGDVEKGQTAKRAKKSHDGESAPKKKKEPAKRAKRARSDDEDDDDDNPDPEEFDVDQPIFQ